MAPLAQEDQVCCRNLRGAGGCLRLVIPAKTEPRRCSPPWRLPDPLIDVFSEDEWDARALQAAQGLIGFLRWLLIWRPEAFFRKSPKAL